MTSFNHQIVSNPIQSAVYTALRVYKDAQGGTLLNFIENFFIHTHQVFLIVQLINIT